MGKNGEPTVIDKLSGKLANGAQSWNVLSPLAQSIKVLPTMVNFKQHPLKLMGPVRCLKLNIFYLDRATVISPFQNQTLILSSAKRLSALNKAGA